MKHALDTRRPRRVLFVGEAVTMAHALRPWALAKSLERDRYEVHFAVDPRHASAVLGAAPDGTTIHGIHTILPSTFGARLASGAPVYEEDELEDYLLEDLALIDEVRPDVVVGDFRVTLAIASQLRGLPYIALIHAHWSLASIAKVPAPDLPAERIFGETLMRAAARVLTPFFFRRHARAFNRVSSRRGLPQLSSVRDVYTVATRTLFFDLPELAPTSALPPHQAYIGPLPVEPAAPLPAWADRIPKDRPVVYASPGSSGDPRSMQAVITSLARNATVLVATAGRLRIDGDIGNVLAAEFLPGAWACRHADVVICNGGTGAVYQALEAGKPVLAVPSNMDQCFVTDAVVRVGAALAVRPSRLGVRSVRHAVSRLLGEPSFREQAARLGTKMATYDPYRAISREIDALVPCSSSPSSAFLRREHSPWRTVGHVA